MAQDDPAHLPNLQALALFLATIDGGSLAAGARRLRMHQPNASRMLAQLEREAGTALLDRSPRGSRPTSAGVVLASHARTLLAAAEDVGDWMRHSREDGEASIRIGASLTIAEHLLPNWLTQLRARRPRTRADLEVANSTQVLAAVQDGALALGFIETPHVPAWTSALTLRQDELAVVVSPDHPWARREGVEVAELAATSLVVREGGSGTREAFEEIVPAAASTPPVQELSSNAAVRIAVESGAGPAVLSMLAVRPQLHTGALRRVAVLDRQLRRPLTAVWTGPRRLSGAAADLLEIATREGR